jgi:hypothetical protein
VVVWARDMPAMAALKTPIMVGGILTGIEAIISKFQELCGVNDEVYEIN